MTKSTFMGATGTVTGSKHLLEIGGKKILIDCGLFQGRKENRLRNWEPLPVSPAEIHKVLLTHAHIDHTGFIPRFCRYGFDGEIHSTYATADLCQIMLRDSAHLQEEDAAWANKKGYSKHTPALPLYTAEDAEKSLLLFHPIFYGEELCMDSIDVSFKFKDAGHILGSSFVEVRRENGKALRKILFSGDVGRPEQPVMKDPTQVFDVDYLVLESTYGDRLHSEVDAVDELRRIIVESYERGGVLVIPAFAVGRTQLLLYLIRQLEERKEIPVLDIYVDSPMAINTTEVFLNHMPDFDLKTRIETLEGKKVFHPERLHICREREESIRINEQMSGAIIISASGMVTGGRILHHLANRLPRKKDTVLFIGYQEEGTRGRAILEGKPKIKIHGRQVKIAAKIENLDGFSGHGDYREIMAWLMGFNQPPEMTFIVHGNKEASAALARMINKDLGWKTKIPKLYDSFELNF